MTQSSTTQLEGNAKPEGFELFMLRMNKKIRSVDPYLTVAGIGLWLSHTGFCVKDSRSGASISCQVQ